MRLISLRDLNEMARLQRQWAPFRAGKNGLACPTCGDELQDAPGEEVIRREDATTFRNVLCKGKKRNGDDCDFKGVRELF